MEKINNYTPGPWEFVKGDSNHRSDRYVGGIRECKDELWIAAVENDVDTDNTHEANAQLIALAPTLYEQHFKMLEALKLVEGGMIQIRQCEATGYPIDTIIKDIKLSVEQTIKECEL